MSWPSAGVALVFMPNFRSFSISVVRLRPSILAASGALPLPCSKAALIKAISVAFIKSFKLKSVFSVNRDA